LSTDVIIIRLAIVRNINKGEPLKLIPWLRETRDMEKQDREAAVKEYKQIATAYPLSEEVYDRLMILYRQLKLPKEEILWINRAIRIFEKKFKSKTVKPSPRVSSLSKSLVRSLGLADKKGKSYYLPEPIARWTKRKDLLEKRMSE
jgi:hypothetical protein